jgi:carbamoyl-phosphate synthase large subunit
VSSEATNLLLTFSGRKSYVFSALARSARAGSIVAADADPAAPIRAHAKTFACVPRASDAEAYLAALEELCDAHAIDAILPLNDLDLCLLTRDRARFAEVGAQVLGAPAATTEILCDKLRAASWLTEQGFRTPETWLASDPVVRSARTARRRIVKERHGQGSQGFRVLERDDDLAALSPTLVVQDHIDGRHFDLDILRAPNGEVVSVVPKEKLESSGGTACITRSVADPRLVELGVALGSAIEHVGVIDVDVIAEGDVLHVLEVNPRLGGCFPFACIFCPQLADALLAIARGESPAAFLGAYRKDVAAAREWCFVELP